MGIYRPEAEKKFFVLLLSGNKVSRPTQKLREEEHKTDKARDEGMLVRLTPLLRYVRKKPDFEETRPK